MLSSAPPSAASVDQALRVLAFETTVYGTPINHYDGVSGMTMYAVKTAAAKDMPPVHVLVDRRGYTFPHKSFTVHESYDDGKSHRPVFSFVTKEGEHVYSKESHVTDELLQAKVFTGITPEQYQELVNFDQHLGMNKEYIARHYYDRSHLNKLRATYTRRITEGNGYEVYGPKRQEAEAAAEDTTFLLLFITDHLEFAKQGKIPLMDGFTFSGFPMAEHVCLLIEPQETVQYQGLSFFYAPVLREPEEETVEAEEKEEKA